MFTRRSWRNQERLFKYLFKPPEPRQPTLEEQITLAEKHANDPEVFSKQRKQWAQEVAKLRSKLARQKIAESAKLRARSA